MSHLLFMMYIQPPLSISAWVSSSHFRVTMSKTKRRLRQCPQLLAARARTAASSDPAPCHPTPSHRQVLEALPRNQARTNTLLTASAAAAGLPPAARPGCCDVSPNVFPVPSTTRRPRSCYSGRPDRSTSLTKASDDSSSRLEKEPKAAGVVPWRETARQPPALRSQHPVPPAPWPHCPWLVLGRR